jgi:cytochrome b6-f complex iron-sulfur subunit
MASSDDPKPVHRRDFLSVAIGGSAIAFGVAAGRPIARFVEPPRRPSSGPTVVGKLEDFPVGTAKTVLVDERPVLVIRSSESEFRAFSALCTHLQCVVRYVPEHKQIECPCHGGVYSAEGQNIAGPPPRPLEELAVSVNDRSIIVSPVG